MALAIDTSHALRTRQELQALVNAIVTAPPSEPETQAVEWKRHFDLQANAGHRFETSKHVLGFGNRTPPAAAAAFEGCGYLVLGAEPGGCAGVPVWDPADLEGWIGRYVAAGSPRWTADYVQLNGVDVLVITVEAPRPGDSVHTLQRAFEGFSAGRVFVRRSGMTVEANPTEIRGLETRLLGGETEVELDVGFREEAPLLVPLGYDQAALEAWVESEATRLWEPFALREPETSGLFPLPRIEPLFETRSRDEYVAEVQQYLDNAPARWRALGDQAAIRQGVGRLQLDIRNGTRGNWERVEVVLTLPSGVAAYLDEDDPLEVLDAPDVPEPWGSGSSVTRSLAALRTVAVADHRIDLASSHTTVRFAATHVRPGETKRLDDLYLLPEIGLAGRDLPIEWRATSTSAHGWAEGSLVVKVNDRAATFGTTRQ